MRILLWHCREVGYTDTKISTRPRGIHPFRPPLAKGVFPEVLLAFVCVESKDDSATPALAAAEIRELAEMVQPKNGVLLVPFAHLSSDLQDPVVARDILQDLAKLLSDSGRKITLASFGTHKDFSLQSMSAYGHAGSVAFREIPPVQPRSKR